MIKNIIFDLGGVILNLDYNLTINTFDNLCGCKFGELYSQKKQIKIFDLFETGKISATDFRKQLKQLLKIEHVSDSKFDNAWNAMLLDVPKENITAIKLLQNNFRIFLFSNTNEIHIDYFFNNCLQDIGIDNFSNCFEKIYLSYQLGLRKPEKSSFNKILKENRLLAEETLFIDDSPINIKGAQIAGLQVLYWDRTQNNLQALANKLQKISVSV